mgnify:CR=1 FL=1|tara:strand:- start:2082 stop:17687 length:15606 start_codon:yes stop_codon:yes gene_type:complete
MAEKINLTENNLLQNSLSEPEINLNDARLDLPPPDTIQKMASQAFEFGNVGPIDPYTENLIDEAAKFSQFVPFFPPNNSMSNPYPGRATPNFNPYTESSGEFNESNVKQREANYRQTIDGGVGFDQGLTPNYTVPVKLNIAASNLDRYYASSAFSRLGFNPFADNERYYNKHMTNQEERARSWGAFKSLFSDAAGSNMRSYGDFFTGDPFVSDFQGARAMQDQMRIGMTNNPGSTKGHVNDFFVNSAYTFGIIGGIALEELALWGAAVLASPFTGGGSLYAKSASTIKNVNTIKNIAVTSLNARKYTSQVANFSQTLNDIKKAESFLGAAKAGFKGTGRGLANFVAPETMRAFSKIKQAGAGADAMTSLAKVQTSLGGFYRDIRSINLALAESKMEAGMEELRVQEKTKKIEEDKQGRPLTPSEMLLTAEAGKKAGLKTLFQNFPTIYLSNKLLIGTAMRGFRRLTGDAIETGIDGARGATIRTTAGRAFKPGTPTKPIVAVAAKKQGLKGILSNLKAAGPKGVAKGFAGGALRFTVLGIPEGVQEVTQEAIASGVTQYYTDLFESATYSELQKALGLEGSIWEMANSMTVGKSSANQLGTEISALTEDPKTFSKYAKIGAQKQWSPQGLKVFLSGFFMRGATVIPQSVAFDVIPDFVNTLVSKEYSELKTKTKNYREAQATMDNAMYNNVVNFYDSNVINMVSQSLANREAFANLTEGEVKKYFDAQGIMVFQGVKNAIKNGSHDIFVDQMESYKKLDDSEIVNIIDDKNADPVKIRKRLDDAIENAKVLKKEKARIDALLPNPYLYTGFEEGTDEYNAAYWNYQGHEYMRDLALFAGDSFRNYTKRKADILQSLINVPVVSNLEASELDVLLSENTMNKEILFLQETLKNVEVTPETKADIEFKKKKLDFLEKIKPILFDPLTIQALKTGLNATDLPQGPVNKLKDLISQYFQMIAFYRNGTVVNANLSENIDKIIDFTTLDVQGKKYNDAIKFFADPISATRFAEEMAIVHKEIYNKYASKNATIKRVNKTLLTDAKRVFLNQLAKLRQVQGLSMVQPVPEQVEAFLKKNVMPTEYFSFDKGVITEDMPESIEIAKLEAAYEEAIAQAELVEKEKTKDEEASSKNIVAEELDELQKEEIEITDESGDVIIPAVDSLDPNAEQKRKAITLRDNFYYSNKPTETLMKDVYALYQNSGRTSLDYSDWKKKNLALGDGGFQILSARYDLFQEYKKSNAAKDFDDWIVDPNNKLLVSNTLEKYETELGFISTVKFNKETSKDDVPTESANQKILETPYDGIFIKQTKIVETGKRNRFSYEVVNASGNNIFSRIKDLSENDDIGSYTTLDKAKVTAKKIHEYNPITPFIIKDLFGETFKTGDKLVMANEPTTTWILKTTEEHWKKNKNLYLVHSEDTSKPYTKKRKKFIKTNKQWTDAEWTIVGKSDRPLSESIKKLPIDNGLKFYGFNPGKVQFGEFYDSGAVTLSQEEADSEFQKIISTTPQEKLNEAELVVERNPKYKQYQQTLKDAENKKIKFPEFDKYNTFDNRNEPNKDLAFGMNEFEITLVLKNKPIAKLRNLGLVTLLDNGKVIHGNTISKLQAEKLFQTNNNPDAYKAIRNNYQILTEINDLIRSKLKNGNVIRIPLSTLPINIQGTVGSPGYTVDNKPASNLIEELVYSRINNEIFIIDKYKTYSSGKSIVTSDYYTTASDLNIIKNITTELTEVIRNNFNNGNPNTELSDVPLGRYVMAVKEPNGTVTFFKLKPRKKDINDLNDIIVEIKETQKKIDDNRNDDDSVKDFKIIDEFNNKLQRDFYIEYDPNTFVTFEFNENGAFQVTYRNLTDLTLGKKGRAKLVIADKKAWDSIETMQDFVDYTNKTWPMLQDFLVDKKIVPEGYKKVPFKISLDNFVKNLDKPLTEDQLSNELNSLVTAEIVKRIRTNRSINIALESTGIKSSREQAVETESVDNVPKNKVVEEGVNNENKTSLDDITELTEDITQDYIDALDAIANQEYTNTDIEFALKVHKYLDNKEVDQNNSDEVFVRAARVEMQENIDNNIAETKSDNITEEEKIQNQLDDITDQYVDLVKKLKLQKVELIKAENPNIKAIDLHKKLDKAVLKDPKVVELDSKKVKLERQLKRFDSLGNDVANKVLQRGETLDGLHSVFRDDFAKEIETILPDFFTIEDIQVLKNNLVDNQETVAAFGLNTATVGSRVEGGIIYLPEISQFGYHEAGHGVWRLLLTDKQQKGYIRELKSEYLNKLKKENKNLKDEIANWKLEDFARVNATDKIATERLIEEYIWDNFQDYANNKKTFTGKIVIFFKKLLNFIKSLFNKKSPYDVQALYDKILTGGFKYSEIVDNQFTRPETSAYSVGINRLAFKNIRNGSKRLFIKKDDGNTIRKSVNTYFDPNMQNQMVANITKLYFDYIDNIVGPYNSLSVLENSIANYIETYNPAVLKEQLSVEDYIKKEAQIEDVYGSLLQTKPFSTRKDILNAVSTYLRQFDVIIEKTSDQVIEPGVGNNNLKSIAEYEKSQDEIGGLKSFSEYMRKLIATTTYMSKDMFGRNALQTVHFQTGYEGLMKATSDAFTEVDVLKSLVRFSNDTQQTYAIVQRVLDKIGLTREDVMQDGFVIPTQITNPLFYQDFINHFKNQTRIDYSYDQLDDETGALNIMSATKKDDANQTMEKWNNAFAARYPELKNDPSFRADAVAALNVLRKQMTKKSITDKALEKQVSTIEGSVQSEIFRTTGINFTPGFLRYAILSNIQSPNKTQRSFLRQNNRVETVTTKDIDAIISGINKKNSKNESIPILFTKYTDAFLQGRNIEDTSEQDPGSAGRFSRLGRIDATFNETVGSSTHITPSGKRIYSQQLASVHMKLMSQLNNTDYLDNLRSDPFYKDELLVNSPAIRDMAENNELRISRVAGYKMGKFNVSSEGYYTMSNNLDVNRKSGVDASNFSGRDVIASVLNGYFIDFVPNTGKLNIKEYDYIDKANNNRVGKYITARVYPKILEANSTLDYVNMPIVKTVEYKNGKSKITEETIDRVFAKIQAEAYEIQREYQERYQGGEVFIPGDIQGYNDTENGRWKKFKKTREYFIEQKARLGINKNFKAPYLNKSQTTSLENLGTSVILRKNATAKKEGYPQGDKILVKINEQNYSLESLGSGLVSNFNYDEIIKRLLNGEISTSSTKFKNGVSFKRGSKTYYTDNKTLRNFLKEDSKDQYTVYYLDKLSQEETDLFLEANEEVVYDESNLKAVEDKLIEINPETNELYTFAEALEETMSVLDLQYQTMETLEHKFALFNDMLINENVLSLVTSNITGNLNTSAGDVVAGTVTQDLNLVPGQQQHNLRQIFFNAYLNASTINKAMLGNTNKSLADATIENKRNKQFAITGRDSAFETIAPEFGINHTMGKNSIAQVLFNDRIFKGAEETDGLIFMTMKGLKYLSYAVGTNKAKLELINRVQQGEAISVSEFLGSENLKGLSSLGAALQSEKYAYGDGKIYDKMSVMALSDELVGDPSTGFTTPSILNPEFYAIHENLKAIENNQEVIALATPTSASKAEKSKVLSFEDISSLNELSEPKDLTNSITYLDANFMYMQQKQVSGKKTISNLKQMKIIVSSEQDNNLNINVFGEEMTLGTLRGIYNKVEGDKSKSALLSKMNLVFSLDDAITALEESRDLGKMTPDLQTFRDFAISSLETSQSSTQMIDLFKNSTDLNNSLTSSKFEQLFLTFFNNTFNERVPGFNTTLITPALGARVKRVKLIENGIPIAWEVVRGYELKPLEEREQIRQTKQGKPLNLKREDNITKEYLEDVLDSPLKEGDLFIDALRGSVVMLNKDGSKSSKRYHEMIVAPQRSYMNQIKADEPIPDIMSDLYTATVPAQDAHSAAYGKIVDFLPVWMASSGMISQDYMNRSGRDLDIDQVYSQEKDVYVKGNKVIEYGDGIPLKPNESTKGINNKSEDTLYEEYLDFVQKEAQRPGSVYHLALKKYKRTQPGSIEDNYKLLYEEDEVEVEWAEWIRENDNPQSPGWNAKDSKERFAKEENFTYNKKEDEFGPKYIQESISPNEVLGALNQLNKPKTKEEYIAYKDKFKSEPYEAANNNILLDTKIVLQSNPRMEAPSEYSNVGVANEPTSIEPLTDVLKSLEKEVNFFANRKRIFDSSSDTDFLNDISRIYNSFHDGAKNIGSIVPQNLNFHIFSEYGLDLRDGSQFGKLVIDGQTYNEFTNPYILDPLNKEELIRRAFMGSSEITGMTDNAKYNIAYFLGLNKQALSTVANGVALGMPIRVPIMMVNHPTIRDVYRSYENIIRRGQPASVEKLVGARIETLTKDRPLLLENAATKRISTEVLTEQLNAWEYVGGVKGLSKTFAKEVETESEAYEILEETELKILQQFLILENIKKATNKFIALTNLIDGVGSSTLDLERLLQSLDDLDINKSDSEFEESNIPIDFRKFFNNTITDIGGVKTQSFLTTLYRMASMINKVTPSVFISKTAPFEQMTNLVLSHYRSNARSVDNKNDVKKSIISYLTAKAFMNRLKTRGDGKRLATLNNGFIYNESSLDSPLTIMDVMRRLMKNNPDSYFLYDFLKPITYDNPNNKQMIDRVVANTWKSIPDAMMVELGRDIANVYTKDEQNYLDMNHLLNYLMVKDGFTFQRDSFISIMPVVLLQDIISSVSPAHSLLKSEVLDDAKYKEVFGATLNEMANEVAISMLTSHKNNFNLQANKSANARIALKKFKDDSSLDYIITAEDSRFKEDISLEQGLLSGKIKAISTEGALYPAIKKDHIIEIGKDDTPYKVVGSFRLSNKLKNAKNFANRFSILTGYTKEYYDTMSKTDSRLTAKGYITILEPVSKEVAEKQPLTMSRGAVQYDSSLGETYVNLFAKLGPTQNRKLRGRLIRKYEGQKQKKYGRKVNTEVFKTTLQKNKYDLNSKGFEIVTTVVNNKTYDLIKFPLVRKIKLGRGKDLKYITEKLINVTVPQFLNRGVGESSMMYNLKADGKPSAILGVNAIYKTTETVGVDSATDIGDVFVGKRPAFSLMMENRADRLELNLPMEDFLQLNPTDVAEAVSEEDAGQLDQLSESVSRVTEKGFENNKGESVTPQQAIKKESTQPLGLSGNLSDYQNIIDNSSLDMSGLKEDASETQEVTNEDSAYLSEEYANFTNFQKQNIAVSKDQGGLGVKSLEDLIALYNDPNQQYSREEFIEDIKKCKGK